MSRLPRIAYLPTPRCHIHPTKFIIGISINLHKTLHEFVDGYIRIRLYRMSSIPGK